MMTIHSIVYQPERLEPASYYSRTPLNQAQLVADYGIEGDMKGGKHHERHLNLMSLDMTQTLAGEGYKTAPGQLGEQIQVSGGDIASFTPGTRLQIGSTAVIELTKARTGCDRFAAIQEHPKENTVGRLGMLARVITSGPIQVGDEIKPLATE